MTTRQELIVDIVNVYIKNHPEDYKKTLKVIKERRKGLRNKDVGTTKDGKMRASFAFPPGLLNTFEKVFGYNEDERFLEFPGEAKWFSKKFPQFLIPWTY